MPNSSTSRWEELPRTFLAAVALIFAAISTLYGTVWMYDVRLPNSQVELGFNHQHNEVYNQKTHSILVDDVVKDSPAERAGLKAADRIIGVNGRMLETSAPYDEAYAKGQPGDPVEFIVARAGEATPVHLNGIFRAKGQTQAHEGFAKSTAEQITGSFPVLFLAVGFAVLFLKLGDPKAWLLALMFCAFAAAPDILNPMALPPGMRVFAFAYRATFNGMLPAFFYLFFAEFPIRSALERHAAWLKWIGLALGILTVFPALSTGIPRFPAPLVNWIGENGGQRLLLITRYGFLGLGMVSLAQNAYLPMVSQEARKKSRVIFWGTIVGVLPVLVEKAARDFSTYQPSFWMDTVLVLLVFLYPLSFAYAVVKHRVMEIPALLRRSARYVLVQRGFIVLLLAAVACAIALFARTFSRFFQTDTNVGMMLSAAFGIALVGAAAPMVKRGTGRIDRAFFRSVYDARMILQELAEKARTVTGRSELAALLEQHLNKALQPKTLVCYFGTGEGELTAQSRKAPAGAEKLRPNLAIFVELAERGKSWEVPESDLENGEELGPLKLMEPECLVPILDHEGRLSGLLVLGPRLSEEPYSSEDKRLLDSVATQAGMALENIGLAEKMAERMEADRRVSRDMEIAREVQSRLFPQVIPRLETLEYQGSCTQARVVGGDYYDFLDLGPGRLGIVLADISGKGIAAALLMANLQANLRSQYTVALEDPRRLLKSVNRLFYENTPEDRYATLFYADYNEARRMLRYVNCGHNPPFLLRSNGELERLKATATVLGLFENWECTVEEATLQAGDVLLIYTDGSTEAPNGEGEEFGENRLLEILRAQRAAPVEEILSAIVSAVQEFSGASQSDDLTLVVAKAR